MLKENLELILGELPVSHVVCVQNPLGFFDEDAAVHSAQATKGVWLRLNLDADLPPGDGRGTAELQRHLTHGTGAVMELLPHWGCEEDEDEALRCG